jgi:PAS domain S-box-containing protein
LLHATTAEVRQTRPLCGGGFDCGMLVNVREVGDVAEASAMVVTDAELRVVDAAGGAVPDGGHSLAEWVGRPLEDLVGSTSWVHLEPRFRSALVGEHQSFRHRTLDGRSDCWIRIAPIRAQDGTVAATVAVAYDITEQVHTTEELARSEARLRESERMIGLGSWELALDDGRITYSVGFASVVGLVPGEPLALAEYAAMVHVGDLEVFSAAIAECLRDGSASCEYRVGRSDGTIRWLAMRGERILADGDRGAYLRGAILDVTEQRQVERERIAALALFEQGFDAAPIGMALTSGSGRYIRVNDAMCSLLGRSRDELMCLSVSEITHLDDRGADEAALRAMVNGDADDYHAEKRYVRPDGTMLWAAVHVAPVRNADGRIEAFFAQKIDITEAKEREAHLAKYASDAEWLGRIRDALDNDRLVLYWQPIVDLRTGETVQRELLLRMRDENGAIIAPGEFLAVAERYGLISEIDRWVIRQAVRLATHGPVEFNLSAASIGDPDVLRELASAIETTGVDPDRLVVEVTETAMMDQTEAGRVFAEQLRALGCHLALDDFGTGFASLSYLKHLHAEHLKIDIEFVRDLARNEMDERLVRGIVGLAREFNQTTTAEGIEDEQTLAKLRELGVERGQGYLFARPCPVDDCEPAKAVAPRPASDCADPIATVRAAFQALADRDHVAAHRLFHPESALHLFATAKRVDHDGAYRGHDGLDQYFRDVEEVWDELRLVGTAFWETNGGVIAFVHAVGRADGNTQTVDTLWVYRLREDLVAGVDVFPQPDANNAPITGGLGTNAGDSPFQDQIRSVADVPVALAGR